MRTQLNNPDEPSQPEPDANATLPNTQAGPGAINRTVGRYQVEKTLGHGGFGVVYLAYDNQLNRHVAIKVPRSESLKDPKTSALYIAEARTVAALDHPQIVPIYDVGSSDSEPCFIVSKFIDGTNLAAKLSQGRIPLADAVKVVKEVASALHHAHQHRLVHRDIKPANILLDRVGNSYLTDFGLAIDDSQRGTDSQLAGTVPYMSPEQAGGEFGCIDGRSDIFSLGTVLYELLTGQRPFVGKTASDVLHQIGVVNPRPPRQLDDKVPSEVEHVCLRALSKQPSDRFSTAKEMADELERALSSASGVSHSENRKTSARQRGVVANLYFGNIGCSVTLALAVLLIAVSFTTGKRVVEWARDALTAITGIHFDK
jgi:eukaryotic-like serine/threonine-protein kinase